MNKILVLQFVKACQANKVKRVSGTYTHFRRRYQTFTKRCKTAITGTVFQHIVLTSISGKNGSFVETGAYMMLS